MTVQATGDGINFYLIKEEFAMASFEERHKKMQEEAAAAKKVSNTERNANGRRKLTATVDVTAAEMEGISKSKLITTKDLCKLVNKVFRPTMPEFEGSRIFVNGNEIVTELFFMERRNASFENGAIKVLQRKSDKAKEESRRGNGFGIISNYNNRNKVATAYDLTEFGQDALSEFIDSRNFKNYNDSIVNWNKCLNEITERNMYGNSNVFVKVTIDIHKILGKIYGTKSANGPVFYEVGLVRPLMQMRDPSGNIFVRDWMFNIVQLDKGILDKALSDAGIGANTGDLGIIR